ncbi:hypothetical protein [Draconibacterium mangrovi]|uniref:hypothetical protein n=1 Tax=Draconibacterium mangrovi TaxID=2697469 RepID=UPI0013D23466|nr:hypothetical protein [Draconibacterium mangrovi]
MSEKDIAFITGLKKTLWQIAGSLALLVVVSGVGFYYKTNDRLNYVEKEQARIEQNKADRNVYEVTIKEIHKDISEINRKLEFKADKQ